MTDPPPAGGFTAVIVVAISAAAASAAHVDFKDPRRALGLEGNVRIDAELAQDTVSSNSPLNVTYQVENLSNSTIAIADKVTDAAFDTDSRTITLTIGAEVPPGPNMPHLVTVNPGEKRVLNGGTLLHINVPTVRTPWRRSRGTRWRLFVRGRNLDSLARVA